MTPLPPPTTFTQHFTQQSHSNHHLKLIPFWFAEKTLTRVPVPVCIVNSQIIIIKKKISRQITSINIDSDKMLQNKTAKIANYACVVHNLPLIFLLSTPAIIFTYAGVQSSFFRTQPNKILCNHLIYISCIVPLVLSYDFPPYTKFLLMLFL